MSMPVTPQDFSEIRWRGHWIWVPEEPITPGGLFADTIRPDAPESHGLFRKTFTLARVPARVPARITADSRYALFVNGREVGRGPARSQPGRLHYDLFDLAPCLQPGQNVLAVYVKYYGTPRAYWIPAAPNRTLGKSGILVCEAHLDAEEWLISDASWKARKATAWDTTWHSADADPGHGLPVEVFDARLFPPDWREATFDDSAWGEAQVVPALHMGSFARSQPPTHPYGPLYPRPIAQTGGEVRLPASVTVETLAGQVDTSVGNPIARVAATLALKRLHDKQTRKLPLALEIPPAGMALLTIDMGRIVAGHVEFELQASAGTVLDLSYLEEPLQDISGFGHMQAGSRYIARGCDDTFQVFDSNGFRYACLLLHGIAGSVTLTRFAVREALYPWREGAAFACDDERINRVFAASVRTVQLCSHDAFIDCPTREQRSWVGDGIVHQMVHLATNQDWRLAWRYLTLANSPRSDGALPMSVVGEIEMSGGYTLPDWALHWVHGVYNCYRFSGDRELVLSLLPTLVRVLRWYAPFQTSGGALKDVVEWNLVDWSSVSTEDTSSVLTCLWARGLRECAEMANWLEEKSTQRWAETLYERARAGLEAFWDEKRGSYRDHIKDGVLMPAMSQLAGALAIVSELAPRERWPRIVETITDARRLVVRSWSGGGQDEGKFHQTMNGIYEIDWDTEHEIVRAEPFMSYTVHDAVALAGRASLLPELYLRWSTFLVDGYDTIGENWEHGTHAHGWSCTPARDLMFYTLGVTPAAPGYGKARIAPRPGRLGWIGGNVPTPHGLIAVQATANAVIIDSPVPVVLDLEGQPLRELDAGQHEISARQV